MDRFTIAWLDPTAKSQYAHLNALQELGISSDPVVIHDTLHECVTHIQCNRSRVLLIVNGNFGEELTQSVHNDSKVEAIYVYCMNVDHHKKWAIHHNKIKCVAKEFYEIINHMKNNYTTSTNVNVYKPITACSVPVCEPQVTSVTPNHSGIVSPGHVAVGQSSVQYSSSTANGQMTRLFLQI
ncbi:unnamed protein product [Adineta ricciae]|uniref:Uncharacterized protein n=1 Tax=Adineta ricciae TaxID=249248 RepID=A0A816CZQ3_ADIRI|nr:unnamed protein product [Adineta ricciae]